MPSKKWKSPTQKKILNGSEDEATRYFKDKTGDQLHQVFTPIVKDSMAAVGVTRTYQELNDKAETMPLADTMSFDLDQYAPV